MKEEIGKYLVDISKLIFAGVVIAQAFNISDNKILMITFGVICAFLAAWLGFNLIKNK